MHFGKRILEIVRAIHHQWLEPKTGLHGSRLEILDQGLTVWICRHGRGENSDTGEVRNYLVQKLQTLASKLGIHTGQSGNVATRPSQAGDKACLQGSASGRHYDWDRSGGLHGGSDCGSEMGYDYTHPMLDQIGRVFVG